MSYAHRLHRGKARRPVRTALLALVPALVFAGCGGGLSEKTFDTDTGDWVLFTQSRLLPFQGGRTAEVLGFVEMDEETGCVYLHQPEFEISYPSVWPAGTVVTDTGLRLGDGRAIPDGEWVYGGGGYFDVDEVEGGGESEQAAILERCPGVNNQYGEVAEFDSPAEEIEIGE